MQQPQPTLWSHRNDHPHKLLAQMEVGGVTEDYRNNQSIFVQGNVADSVFFIQKGRVKLTVTSEHGKEAVIGILDEGQFCGEGCLQGPPVRAATAIALGDCRITSITKAAMLSAIRDQPAFSKLFLDHLLSRNSRIQEDVVDQLFNSSEKRRTHPTSAVLSEAWYFVKRVALSLALRSSGDAGRGFGRIGAAAALVAG